MRGPSPRKLLSYATRCLRLDRYFQSPGDGRKRPQIPAKDLIWGQVICQVIRECSFLGIQRLVRFAACAQMGLSCKFSDDTLAYFNDRLDPEPTRNALVAMIKLAKRKKVFRDTDSTTPVCSLCRPIKNANHEVIGHNHQMCMISVVGTSVSLPFDNEPYGAGDSEYSAGLRILPRSIKHLGPRFAQYVVADAKFASAEFLNGSQELGLGALVRLKDNVPLLHQAAMARFENTPPHQVHDHDGERVEIWDAEDFDPWEGLRWSTVRVLRYRQHRRDGSVIDAYWLTDMLEKTVGSFALFKLAKSRWEIENQGFNEGKTRHGMRHICRHESNSVLIGWLLLSLALAIERLFRCCHLHRGTHPVRTAADLVVLLWLALGERPRRDSG